MFSETSDLSWLQEVVNGRSGASSSKRKSRYGIRSSMRKCPTRPDNVISEKAHALSDAVM